MKDLLNVLDSRCADVRFQDGALPHAMGVKSFQVMRANRAHPELSDGFGWTYNHAPEICYAFGKIYMEYLSDPVSEHEAPGHTLLTWSENGQDWSFPVLAFPEIEVSLAPYNGPKAKVMPQTVKTVAHQRMAFYVASNGVVLATAFYGIVHDREISAPCDGWGVGRAVRRIHEDGSLGEIHYLIYNTPAGYTEENAPAFTSYAASKDAAFVAACEELLGDGAMIRQMFEEQRFDKNLFPNPGDEALCFYTVAPNKLMGVYKRGRVSISEDNGRTWGPIIPNPTVKTATGKVWGQRTSDGQYALMYNPTTDGQHRWPIAVVTGPDGHDFDHMLSVTGYMSPLRYGGIDKNLGPQYLRGICERNPQTPDGDIWLSYSNNKEDLWISRIPVPVLGRETACLHETFGEELPERWNVYSPAWCPVRMENGALTLRDADPYDRAAVERMLRPQEQGRIALQLRVDAVSGPGGVSIELQDDRGCTPILVSLRKDRQLYVRGGGRTEPYGTYPEGTFTLEIAYDCRESSCRVKIGDWEKTFAFSASVNEITRLHVATKENWQIPYATTNSVGKYGTKEQVLPGCEEKTEETAVALLRLDAE